jgi:type I restriction enzyme S subunit
MIKLGDIVTITTGKNKTPDDKKGKLYPYYGTSGITGYTDHFLEDGDYILTARNGTIGNTFIINGKSYPSDHMFTIRTKPKCILKYLYYWIMSNKNIMINLANVTTIPGITRASLVDIIIPLPSLERQQQIVESIDGFTQLVHHEEQALTMLEKQVMFFVKEMGRGQPRVKLGDVCEIKYGDKNKFHETTELYPGIGGGVAPSSYVTNWNIDAYTPIVSRSGSAGHISRYPTRASAGSFAFVCITNNNIVNNDYLYFVLKNDEEYIKTLPEGTVQKNMNRDVLRGVDIQLPPLAEQQTLQSDFEEIRHKQTKIAEYKKKAQDTIKRLIPGA